MKVSSEDFFPDETRISIQPPRPKCVIGAADPNNMCKTAFDTGALMGKWGFDPAEFGCVYNDIRI